MSEVKVKKANPVVEYIQESYLEMKRVTWPTRNQAVRLTLLVLGFCIAAAVVIGAMDALFSFGHQKLIDFAASTNFSDTAPVDSTTSIPVSIPASSATQAESQTIPATGTQQ